MFLRIGAVVFASTSMLLSAFASQGGEPDACRLRLETAFEGGEASPVFSLDLIAQGEALYDRHCTACHSLDRNRVGPKHRGVYGRSAGTVSDFRYSKALRALDIVWNEDTLDAWLKNPPAFAPGTSMGFRLNDPEKRRAIIAYLKSQSDGCDES